MNHPTGADDIDKIPMINVSEPGYLKVALSDLPLLKHLKWIPYYFDGDEIKKFDNKAITNLLETERERVLDILEAEAVTRLEKWGDGSGYDYVKVVPVEVIERLRGASVRKAKHSPETNLTNNATGVEEKS